MTSQRPCYHEFYADENRPRPHYAWLWETIQRAGIGELSTKAQEAYLALHTGTDVRLTELLNRVHGTDTYAFLCKGKDYMYKAVLGEPVDEDSNFRIVVDDVVDALP